MKNAMQLKSFVKKIATEKNIPAQVVLQNYMFERFLERVSKSAYQPNFIIKGGFLIAAVVGLDTRTTMDIDATIKSLELNEEKIRNMIMDICAIDLDDNVVFLIKGMEEIRESADYTGLRVSIEAKYKTVLVPLKIDLTTGDKITPKEVVFKYDMFSKNKSITLLSYNLETILAEKLETIISRGELSTRPRDYYDVFIIEKLMWHKINISVLQEAFRATIENRQSLNDINNYQNVIKRIVESETMQTHWRRYQKQFSYANAIDFENVCAVINKIMTEITIIN